jgi:hypothetical protein
LEAAKLSLVILLMNLRIAPVAQSLFAAALFLLPLLSCAEPAGAQDPQGQTGVPPQTASPPPDFLPGQISAVPNRPTFSTTAESLEPGVLEIEYGFELGDGHQNTNGLIKFGATGKLELRFANNPIERDSGTAGAGDSGALQV